MPKSVGIGTGTNGTTFSWEVLGRATHLALTVLAGFVQRPAFQEGGVHIRQREAWADIIHTSLGHEALRRLALGTFPGLASPTPEEDAFGLAKLNGAILREIYDCVMTPVGAEFVVVGPTPAAEVIDWAKAEWGAWSPPRADAATCARWLKPPQDSSPVEQRDWVALEIVRTEPAVPDETEEPYVLLAAPGPPLLSEDYVPFLLLSQVLERREQGAAAKLRHAGATYGLQSYVTTRFPQSVVLVLSGRVELGSVRDAVRNLVLDVRGLAQSLTVDELDVVKRHWRNTSLRAFASNTEVANQTRMQLERGRPPNQVVHWPDELLGVTLEHCQAVASRWLSSAQPTVAIKTQRKDLADFTQGLGFNTRVHEVTLKKPGAQVPSAAF
jgi:predicted Zn-dependent peptidase